MVAPCAPKTPTIDRSACPARRHGTRSARYDAGCVCPDGYLDAKRARVRKETRRLLVGRLVSGVGAARRLQGLAVLGYGLPVLAERLGQDRAEVGRLRRGRAQILATTHRAVLHLTDELAALPAPTDGPGKQSGVARARAHAARQDWVALDQWVDIDDPLDVPDAAFARADAGIASDDLLELAEWHTTVDDAGVREVDHAAIAAVSGLTVGEVAHRLRFARTGPRLVDTDADRVDAIRAEYRAAEPGTFNRTAVARRHDVRPDAVDRALRGSSRNGYPDLVAQLGPKWTAGRRQSGQKLTDERIHAVRAEYSAGDGYRRLAARHGIAMSLVRRIVRGDIRPHLGLTDLTVQQGGHTPAATPTGRVTRKEDVA